MPSVRPAGSRLRAISLVAMSALAMTLVAATVSTAGAATPTTPATSAAGSVVGAVIELTPPAGSDRVVARLAATHSGLTRAQRMATLTAAAPALGARDSVVAWAEAHGLTVSGAGRWTVSVNGSAAAMSAAFATPLVAARSRFASAGPASYLRPVTAPKVPAALAGVATSVVGLDTRPVFAPRVLKPAALGDSGFTGDQLRDAYGAPRDPAAGAGITVGTIQFSGFNSLDFLSYAAAADIPLFNGQLVDVAVDGANPAQVVGNGDVEVDLDTQAILSVAPMARQRLYFPPNTLTGEVDAFAKMADDATAGLLQVVSSSWGHCESDLAFGEAAAVQAQIQRLVGAGATMSASSGDGGSNDCGGTPASNQVDFPTSIPEVVSVGGTSLVNGYQTAWNGSGGGSSLVFGKPGYQTGIAGSTGTHRTVPDVAMLADPNTGFAVIHNDSQITVGGTSLAAPLFAGLLAGALSEAGQSTGVGDIHSLLYAAPAADFQDVVSGNNGSFTTAVGYDEVTGLGAPRFRALATDLGLAPLARTQYHPINPTRIADTRNGTGVAQARLGPGQSVSITIPASATGVPANTVTAAVVNVTAINPTVSTYLSVFPTGAAGATSSSSVNVVPGVPIPNLVTVKTDASGRISIYNHAGTIDVAVDLAGYYARDTGDLYTPLNPARVLDTRAGTGGVPVAKVGQGGTVTLHVAGAGGVPASGVEAVTLNVTAVGASASSHVSVYPADFADGPLSSNLNVAPAKAVANAVISKVSAAGDITFSNAFGSVDLVADVQGYYTSGSGMSFVPVPPVRILDTRPGGLGPNASGPFDVAASGSRAGAVVLNLTGVSPTSATFLSLFPSNVPVAVGRTSSSLNLDAHAVRANLTTTAIHQVDPLTEIVYNHTGNISILADVSGYFSGQPTALPQTSVTLSAPGSATAGTPVAFSASATTSGPSVSSLAPGAVVVFVEPGVGVRGTVVIGSDGSAVLTTSSLAVGSHTLYAVVAAHDGIAGSTSTPITVTIT